MKKLFWILVAVAALGLVVGGSAFAAPKKLSLVFVTPLIAHPVWDVARAGFEAAAKDLGFDGQYVGPQGIDPAEMVNQIELAIERRGVDLDAGPDPGALDLAQSFLFDFGVFGGGDRGAEGRFLAPTEEGVVAVNLHNRERLKRVNR